MDFSLTVKNYRCFPDTSPLNITLRDGFTAFVGTNNSGKSSILRFFHEFRPFLEPWSGAIGNQVDALKGTPVSVWNFPATVRDPAEVFSDSNTRDLLIDVSLLGHDDNTDDVTKLQLLFPRDKPFFTAKVNGRDYFRNNSQVSADGTKFSFDSQQWEFAHIYSVCRSISKTLYVGPFRNIINVGSNEPYFDIRVGQNAITQWREFKTGYQRRLNQVSMRLTEDLRRIFGFNSLDIGASNDNASLHLYIDGKSYRSDEVGSGLAQFFVVLLNAALIDPEFILIDEPELNLHPTLQVDFLTTLGSYAKRGVLFTTHSMGLARTVADQIYSVRRVRQGESEVVPYGTTPRLAEFLGEMSFSGYQELGFDRILLVEGSTDVRVMQQFLRLYGKDHQIVILPLGGRGMIKEDSEEQLREITRITSNVAAVIDSERTKTGEPLQPRIEGFRQACGRAGVNCKVLDLRATENYLSDSAVKRVKGPSYQALAPYQLLNQVTPTWSKSENWRIAREMTVQELDATDLGAFLKAL